MVPLTLLETKTLSHCHHWLATTQGTLWKRTLTIAGGICLRDPRTPCPLPTPSPTRPPTTSRTGSPAVNWYNLLVFNPIRPCLIRFHKVKTRLRSTLDPLRSLSRSDTWQVTKEVPKEQGPVAGHQWMPQRHLVPVLSLVFPPMLLRHVRLLSNFQEQIVEDRVGVRKVPAPNEGDHQVKLNPFKLLEKQCGQRLQQLC